MIGLSYPSAASNPTLDQLKVAIGGSLGVSPSYVDVTVTSTTRRRLLGVVSVTARVSFPTIASASVAQAKILLVKSLQVNGVSVSVVSVSLLDPGQTTMPSTTPTPAPETPGVSPVVLGGAVVGGILGFVVITIFVIYAARMAKPKVSVKYSNRNSAAKVSPSLPNDIQSSNSPYFVFHDPVAVRISQQLTPDRYLSGPRLVQVLNRPLLDIPNER